MNPDRHSFPQGYAPMSYCRGCGRDFAGDAYFDRHRVGDHDPHGPKHKNGRRCASDQELRAKGLRPMTNREMQATQAHRRRAGYGITVWFDPVKALRARSANYASDLTPSAGHQ